MGIFTKETRTVFRRNEAGEVERAEHTGDAALNAERVDERRAVRAARWSGIKRNVRDAMEDRVQRRALERAAYKESYHRGRIERAKRRGHAFGLHGVNYGFNPPPSSHKRQGSMVWNDPFSTPYHQMPKKKVSPNVKYTVIGGKAYQVAGSGKKHKYSKKNHPHDPMKNMMRSWGFR